MEKKPRRRKPSAKGEEITPDALLIVTSKENPYAPNSDAYNHLEAMRDSKTIGEYLANCSDRQMGKRLLRGAMRSGIVRLR